MNRFLLVILSFFVLHSDSNAQGITLNFDLDTTVWDVAEPLGFWIDFLETKNDSLGAVYWNNEEIEQYGSKEYFLLGKEANFGMPDFLEFISYSNIRILSVRERGEYYKISNSLSFENEQGGQDLYFMFHIYVGYENEELKLYNALKVNSDQHMSSKKVGFLTYHFPKNHLFNPGKAQKQNDFLEKFANDFGVPVVDIDYYFTETAEQMQEIKGFDFIYGDNGEDIPTGIAYVKDKTVFTSGAGEYYPHEIIHVLLSPHFKNAHGWINEGVATYFGMSRGKELSWHLSRLKKHLQNHPEIDLNNMLELINLDSYTGYRYVLGGFIVQLIYEKNGIWGVKEAMSAGRTDADFYALIEAQLDIKQEELNQVFRKKINALPQY